MSWFKRKPKEFDYAAIRIGNVYVLPPTEEDARAFRKKRRRELTRRGFLIGGIAVALGALSIPLWPRGSGKVSARDLLPEFQKAQANPPWLKDLCLEYCQGKYPAEIRRLAIDFMICFTREQDATVCQALWDRVRNDPAQDNRRAALEVLLHHLRQVDVPALKTLYESEPWARPTIDQAIETIAFPGLRRALRGR